MQWAPDGNVLATGSYSGDLRFWSGDTGELLNLQRPHKGPMFSLKWNPRGTHLLTAGVDKTVTLWDTATYDLLHRYHYHTQPVLEIDWRDNDVFATCSSDKTVQVCRLGDPEPIKKWDAHRLDVNEISWSPGGDMLASCSDDTTAKIWRLDSDVPVHDLRAHDKEVFSLAWSPTGPNSPNPNLDLLLATYCCPSISLIIMMIHYGVDHPWIIPSRFGMPPQANFSKT